MTSRAARAFEYWNIWRKGTSQADIAKTHNISKQAVSKSIRKYSYRALVNLLGLAESIGGLVEWHDEHRGILVGIIPQLDSKPFVMVVDNSGKFRVFYHSTTPSPELRKALQGALHHTYTSETFEQLIKELVKERPT